MTTQERVQQNGAAFEACRDKLLDIERAYVAALKDLREAEAELKQCRDERRRLLAFRDAFDRLVFNVGSGADERHRFRVVRECRAAVADISEDNHADSDD